MLLNCGVGEDSWESLPWTARRSNQSLLKEISPGCSLEGLMLKLKLQYFGHLMRRADHLKRPWCGERLRAGGEGDNRGWDGWMASPTKWTRVWVNSGSWWWTGRSGALQFMGSQRVGHDWVTESNWTELMAFILHVLGDAGDGGMWWEEELWRFWGNGEHNPNCVFKNYVCLKRKDKLEHDLQTQMPTELAIQ